MAAALHIAGPFPWIGSFSFRRRRAAEVMGPSRFRWAVRWVSRFASTPTLAWTGLPGRQRTLKAKPALLSTELLFLFFPCGRPALETRTSISATLRDHAQTSDTVTMPLVSGVFFFFYWRLLLPTGADFGRREIVCRSTHSPHLPTACACRRQ